MSAAREELRARARTLMQVYDAAYWRGLDERREYPQAFAQAFGASRLLAALIPAEYGGLGADLGDACAIVEEINHAGGNAGTAHAQMYTMGTVLRHGSDIQRRTWLPRIASGELRLQAFGVTEPEAGSDTTRITTTAQRRGDVYVVNGRKRWTSRFQHADAMLLLARTAESTASRRGGGLSVFLVDLHTVPPGAIEVWPIRVWMNNETNEIALHDLAVPAENLIGEEGAGFAAIVDGWNAERILIAAECVGHGRFLVERSALRQRAVRLRKAVGCQSVDPVPDRSRPCRARCCRSRHARRGRSFRPRRAVRSASRRCEIARERSRLASRERGDRCAGRKRIRGRLRRRADRPRNTAVHRRAVVEQSHPRLPRAKRARHAEVDVSREKAYSGRR